MFSTPPSLLHHLLQYESSPPIGRETVFQLAKFIKDWRRAMEKANSCSNQAAFFSIGSWSHKIALVFMPLVASAGIRIVHICESILSGQNFLSNYFNSFNARTDLTLPEIKRLLAINKALVFSVPQPITAFFEKNINLSRSRATSLPRIELNLLTEYIMVLALLTGAKRILFDLRIGPGSILPRLQEARNLALLLQKTCLSFNIKPSFMLINMGQPLGQTVGSPWEVSEAIQSLKGKGPLDILKLSLEYAVEVILTNQRATDRMEVKKILKRKLINKEALFKLRDIIEAQGGQISLGDYYLAPLSESKTARILAQRKGYVQGFNLKIFHTLRTRLNQNKAKEDLSTCLPIGILINRKIGDKVEKNELLAEVYFQRGTKYSAWCQLVKSLFILSPTPPPFQPLLIEKLKDNFFQPSL